MAINYKSFWNKTDKEIYEAMVGSEPGSEYWQHLNTLVMIRTGNRNKWLSVVVVIATIVIAVVAVLDYFKPSTPPTVINQSSPRPLVIPKDGDIDPLGLFTPEENQQRRQEKAKAK